MFYPDLARRELYATKADGSFYSDYGRHKQDIEEDCKFRCVYCDIHLHEHGGEGFQLDHFRPQDFFKTLAKDPANLVCSCPKCNRLKSNHWPKNYPKIAFIDPFEKNRVSNFDISELGVLSSSGNGKANYQIKLLDLNRPSRVQMRRARFILSRKNILLDKLSTYCSELNTEIELHLNTGSCIRPEVPNELQICLELIQAIRSTV